MRLFRLGLVLLLWPLSIWADLEFENEDQAPSNRVSLETTFGKGIGVDKSYSTLGSLFIFPQGNLSYLVDARWHHFCNGSNAANLGLGLYYRQPCFHLGAYVYYDWLHRHDNFFNQASIGAEIGCNPWILIVNAYLPYRSKYTYNKTRCSFEGGFSASIRNIDFTCQMVSLEVSREPYCFYKNYFKLSGGIGPYYVANKKSDYKIGGRGRVSVQLSDYLYMDLFLTADPIFKTRVQAVVGVSFPLFFISECFKGYVCDQFFRPRRQGIIAIESCKSCNFNWEDK